jgi:hypothetical protein
LRYGASTAPTIEPYSWFSITTRYTWTKPDAEGEADDAEGEADDAEGEADDAEADAGFEAEAEAEAGLEADAEAGPDTDEAGGVTGVVLSGPHAAAMSIARLTSSVAARRALTGPRCRARL